MEDKKDDLKVKEIKGNDEKTNDYNNGGNPFAKKVSSSLLIYSCEIFHKRKTLRRIWENVGRITEGVPKK